MNSLNTLLKLSSLSTYMLKAFGPVKYFFWPTMWVKKSSTSTKLFSQIASNLLVYVPFCKILMVFWQMLKHTFLVAILFACFLDGCSFGSESTSTSYSIWDVFYWIVWVISNSSNCRPSSCMRFSSLFWIGASSVGLVSPTEKSSSMFR